MRSITRLFGALGALADSILALSAVVDVATGKLRQQLALDGEPAAPALPHAGAVLDNGPSDSAPARPLRRAKVN